MAECMYGNGNECGAMALDASIYCDGHQERADCCEARAELEALRGRLQILIDDCESGRRTPVGGYTVASFIRRALLEPGDPLPAGGAK